jgi:APA family basic amino acid/polyamine antiporter
VLSTDLRGALGFSSFGVLIYYAIANASAFTQPATDRRWPRALQVVGVLGCLTLAFALPAPAVLAGVGVLALGVAGRSVRRGPPGRDVRP